MRPASGAALLGRLATFADCGGGEPTAREVAERACREALSIAPGAGGGATPDVASAGRGTGDVDVLVEEIGDAARAGTAAGARSCGRLDGRVVERLRFDLYAEDLYDIIDTVVDAYGRTPGEDGDGAVELDGASVPPPARGLHTRLRERSKALFVALETARRDGGSLPAGHPAGRRWYTSFSAVQTALGITLTDVPGPERLTGER